MNREKFPLLKNVIYLDSAAAGLKPVEVVNAINEFYLEYPINPHSADSRLGVLSSAKVEESRKLVADLVKASDEEVIFTSGTTDSLNKIAFMLKDFLKSGDEILLSHLNHSSNIIPWIEVAKKQGAKIVYSTDLAKDINEKTKIVAYAQVNNTLDEKIDPKTIYALAKKVGALVINDAAQAVVHADVSLEFADVIAFSGNKIYGPTGIGTLVIKKDLLNKLSPVTFGGGAVVEIKNDGWIKKDGVHKFEPGTLNVAGIVGLGAAIKYKNSLVDATSYELRLAQYAFDKLSTIKDINIYSKRGDLVIMFNIGEYSPQDVVSYLGHKDIILRAGQHCARVVDASLGYTQTIRASLAHYNNDNDIDMLVKALNEGGDFLDFI